MADEQTPLDSQTLLAWLDRMSSQHNANRIAAGEDLSPEIQNAYQQLEKLRAVLLDQVATASAIEVVRLLIAGGVVKWRAPTTIPGGDISALCIQELVAAALWPLVMTLNLPSDWEDAVQEITSPETRQLIVNLREHRRKEPPIELARSLAKAVITPSHATGVGNLLEDLRDEQRGGAARIALLTIRDGQRPPAVPNIKTLLWWILTSAGAGIIGNRVDAWFFVPFWEDISHPSQKSDVSPQKSRAL